MASITATITEDIRSYEQKFVGSLTKRQFFFGLAGIIIGATLAFSIPTTIDNKLFIAFVCAIPIGICGFIDVNKTSLDIFVLRLLYMFVMTPRNRKEKSKPWLLEDKETLERKREEKMLSKMSSSKRRKYLKEKKNPKIKYSTKKEYKIYT